MRAPIVSMPGKSGDLVLTIPTIRALAHLYQTPVKLLTTRFCEPAFRLLLAQPDLVESIHVYEQYRPTADAPGLQPIHIPVPSTLVEGGHRDLFALGLRRYPTPSETLSESIAAPYGVRIADGPWLGQASVNPDGPLLMHAPVAESWTHPVLRALLERRSSSRRVWLVGPAAEYSIYQSMRLDQIDGVELRETEDLMAVRELCDGASGFLGVASAPAVVAAGCGLPSRWVMRPGSTAAARAVIDRAVPRGCPVSILRGLS